MSLRLIVGTALLLISKIVSAQVTVSQVSITSPPVAPSAITSTNGAVIFKAENEIILVDGFGADMGSDFWGYIIPPASFTTLKSSLDGGVAFTIDNKLSFMYEEKYTEGTLNYRIYDYKRKTVTNNPLPVLTKTFGANYYTIDISSLYNKPSRADLADAYYVLEVTNEKGEKSVLRFKYEPVN